VKPIGFIFCAGVVHFVCINEYLLRSGGRSAGEVIDLGRKYEPTIQKFI